MKKILIFFLALLPFVASAQNADRVFELFGYSKFKLGEMTLSYTSADGLLVNGAKATAAQISTVTQALLGSNSPITSGGVYSALLLQNRKLKFSLDSLSKLKADSALKKSRQTIDSLIIPLDAGRFLLAANGKAGIDTAALHAQVKSWAAGTAYTPVPSYSTITDANSQAGTATIGSYNGTTIISTTNSNIHFGQVYSLDSDGIHYYVSSTYNGYGYGKLFYDGFVAGKKYRLTIYNATMPVFLNLQGSNISATSSAGSNYVFDFTYPAGGAFVEIDPVSANGLYGVAGFKLEVQN